MVLEKGTTLKKNFDFSLFVLFDNVSPDDDRRPAATGIQMDSIQTVLIA